MIARWLVAISLLSAVLTADLDIISQVQQRIQCTQTGLTSLQCGECVSKEKLLRVLATAPQDHENALTTRRLHLLLFQHLVNFRQACSGQPVCETYEECVRKFESDLKPTTAPLINNFEAMLRDIKTILGPTGTTGCFTAESVLQDVSQGGVDVTTFEGAQILASVVMDKLLKGQCIEVGAVTDFIEDLFKRYGDNSSERMSEDGLRRLLQDLRIFTRDHDHSLHAVPDGGYNDIEHDHDHDHGSDGHAHGGHSHHDHEHNNSQHGHHAHHDSEEDHSTENSDQRTPVTPKYDHDHDHHHPEGGDHHDHEHDDHHAEEGRPRRSVPKPEEHSHTSMAKKCWTTAELVGKFGEPEKKSISRNEFMQLCPAVVQQAVSSVCNADNSQEENKTPVTKLSLGEQIAYSSIAVLIVSLCSLAGVLILPFLARYAYYYIMMGFIGLSFGTMAGDAFLHLIPQILGLHTHDAEGGHGGHDHSHGSEEEESYIPAYFWKQICIVGFIYALFLFETIFSGHDHDEKDGGHGHSHVPEFQLKSMKKSESRKTLANNLSSASVSDMGKIDSSVDLEGTVKQQEEEETPNLKSKPIWLGMTSLALMIIVGGAVHNLADGLAIGAAFSSGAKGGISTTLAVFFHELPHELGDFVVLVSTGLSYKKALILNFFSSIVAFVGLIIGLYFGQDVEVRNWFMTFTVAIFIYVAFVDMLPAMKKFTGKSPKKMFIVKNAGVIAGLTIMSLIAIFEDKLPI